MDFMVFLLLLRVELQVCIFFKTHISEKEADDRLLRWHTSLSQIRRFKDPSLSLSPVECHLLSPATRYFAPHASIPLPNNKPKTPTMATEVFYDCATPDLKRLAFVETAAVNSVSYVKGSTAFAKACGYYTSAKETNALKVRVMPLEC